MSCQNSSVCKKCNKPFRRDTGTILEQHVSDCKQCVNAINCKNTNKCCKQYKDILSYQQTVNNKNKESKDMIDILNNFKF